MARAATTSTAATAIAAADVKAVRAFNRFYTQRIGVLKPYLDSDFTLTEVRVLYEIAHRPELTARDLVRELALDPGYLSRILKRFEQRGWLQRRSADHDARRSLLRLTEAGYATFAPLQQKSRDETADVLAAVPAAARPRLLEAMQTVQKLMAPEPAPPEITLRPLRAGDWGWVVAQHGAIYAREYGYDTTFEGQVAGIVSSIVARFDPAWDRGWIAEVDGERVGSVFVVRKSPRVAQLRLLILTPQARGLGLGARLVDESIRFASSRGYAKLVLWTHGQLDAARAIYRARGFRCTGSEPLAAYGQPRLTSETWELRLPAAAAEAA